MLFTMIKRYLKTDILAHQRFFQDGLGVSKLWHEMSIELHWVQLESTH
jgi:hypothetical protein